ncbi:hypothetical protein ACFE04_020223 [Oxalis oulophora]
MKTQLVLIIVFVIILIIKPSSASSSTTTNYNVLSFGAKPNGVVDSTKAFLGTWNAACSSSSNRTILIYVPKGRYLIGSSLAFQGPCNSPAIILRIDGTLVAPSDYHILAKVDSWLTFHQVDGLSVLGGSLDAKGSSLWACKSGAAAANCPSGTTTLKIMNSNNINIRNLLSINSQMFNIVIHQCKNVNMQGVKILSAGNSPNTDGIHVQSSTNVEIRNATIKTGDDCVSIGPGTKNLWIEQVTCGPGHGISIGSLGKDQVEEGVQNVTVLNTVFSGSTNGFRIKTWGKPSNSFVQGIRYIGASMKNVQNPILIDQNYCPQQNCPGKDSGVKINDVLYQDIKGTSATPVAIKFDCSSKYPCSGIKLQNVYLTYRNRQVAQSSCSNVKGSSAGLVQPDSCI